MAWNAGRQFNTVTKAKNKKGEKLSSGYRINRAADDAAGLSISEKMRRQIRGLKVGTENAQMGISWVQIGEGALNEAHDILHRMNELSIKAQNGTNTLTDRAYMEAEFEQLQNELDRISTTTTFNELNIFEEHEPVYDQISGNIQWDYEEYHEIKAGKNDLTITYRTEATDEAQTMTISVAAGRYTTHELIDAIDDAFGVDSPIHMEFTDKGICRLNLEGGEVMDSVTGGLTYLMWDNYDGGGYGALIGTTEFEKATDRLEIVQGQNDYMKFQMEYFDKPGKVEVEIDMFQAANLIPSISAPINDPNKGLTLKLTKEEVMKAIDNWLQVNYKDTGLKTAHHGNAIQLSSDLGIVTGFKGNMFKIENKDPIFTSVFYDNIQEGYVWQDPASVVGGAVLTTDSRDQEHNRYYIDDTNNKLVLQPNLTTAPVEIEITVKKTDAKVPGSDPTKPDFDPTTLGYTAKEMVDELNAQFVKEGIDGEVQAYLVQSKKRVPYPDGKNPGGAATAEDVGDDMMVFEGVEIRTVKEGPDAIVNIDKNASTAYDTLFTTKNYNMYGKAAADATVANETKLDVNAYAVGTKVHTGNIAIDKNNNKFVITLRSTVDGQHNFDVYDSSTVPTDYSKSFTVTLDNGTRNLADTIKHINAKLGQISMGKDAGGKDIFLGSRIEAVNDGGKIKIQDKEDLVLDDVNNSSLNWYTEIDLSSASGNSGYRVLFQQSYTYTVPKTVSGKGSLTLTGPGSGPLTITVNGTGYDYYLNGSMSASQIADMINEDTDIKFSDADGKGETKPENFTVMGDGTRTIPYYAGDHAVGISKPRQGKAGYEINTPAELEIGPTIPASMVVDDDCNQITIALNGKPAKTLTLENSVKKADGTFSSFDTNKDGKYSQAELVEALQAAIDNAFGTGMGGALVSIKNNRLVLTSRLPSDEDGSQTSITTYAQGQATNTFFDSLHDTETAASCTSKKVLQSSITLKDDGDSDIFTFKFTDEKGNSQVVSLDLVDSTEVDATNSKTFTRAELVKRINDKLEEAGHTYTGKVSAKADSTTSNYLVLTTTGTGDKTHIEYTTGPAGSTEKNATALFGNLDNDQQTTAQITLDRNAKKSVSYTGDLTFQVRIGPQWHEVHIKDGWTSPNTGINSLQYKLNYGANGNDGLLSMGVTATVDANGKITLKMNTAGSGSLHMDYDHGGTVMKTMFGTEKKAKIPGVTVKNDGAKLVITGGKNDIISVTSTTSGGMVKGTEKTGYYTHNVEQGFHDPKYSTVTSADLTTYVNAGGIKLDKWNNQLEFTFSEDNGKTTKNVSFRLTESAPNQKTVIDDIKTELQQKIDAALGADKVKVLFENNKLIFKSLKPGAQFQFEGMASRKTDAAANPDKYKMGGGFFHHVMCQYTTTTKTLDDPTDINGDQFAGDIFAQGRHDVKFDRTKLKPGVSDTLEMDLTFVEDKDHNGKLDDAEKKDAKTITLTLNLDTKKHDWESFGSEELLENFRKALKAAIRDKQADAKAMGFELHEDMINVDIGRHQTDIWGNMDDVSLSFTITKDPDVATPVEGYFYIDGIRGNAAYESFYYTEGELIPAYITGTKDISGGVTLGKDDNELVFLVDGKMQKVDLSDLEKGKKYAAEDFIQTLTNKFKEQGLELAASITDKGSLKISYKKMGAHRIEQVTGSARDILFFEEHAKKRPHREREIRVSSNEGDRIEVYSPRFSTSMLGINSICISTIENAEKATNRLKRAIEKVSEMRNTFGAIQNRIEHTINNNRNKEENTQAAESRIRDADISKEMMEFSALSIIQQAGQSILAQANQSRNAMLTLLQ